MWPALGADRGSEPISVREYLHPPPPCPTQVLPFHRSLRDRKCVFLAQLHPVTAGEILVGAGITRPDFPRRRCEESRRGCQLCKQATARVPFRLPPMASREGCPGLEGGILGPACSSGFPILRLLCPQQLTEDRGGSPTVGRGDIQDLGARDQEDTPLVTTVHASLLRL